MNILQYNRIKKNVVFFALFTNTVCIEMNRE